MTVAFQRRYPGFRGLGQDPSTDPGFQAAWSSVSTPISNGSSSDTSGGGIDWTSLANIFNTGITAAGKAFTSYQTAAMQQNLLNRGLYQNPTTGQVLPTSTFTSSSMMPILLIGGALILMVMMGRQR